MKTQSDQKVRVVSLYNLLAMCKEVSGTCHTFAVVKVSRSRVHVEYSNPDEYGNGHPMVAVYPCYPSVWAGDEDNPRVVLDMLRVIGDSRDGEGWQAFGPLMDCSQLWRGQDGAWQTERAILHAKLGATVTTAWDKHGCMILGWDVTLPDGTTKRVEPNDDAVTTYLRERDKERR